MTFIPKQIEADEEVISYWIKKTRWTQEEFAALYCGVNPYAYKEDCDRPLFGELKKIEKNKHQMIEELEILIKDRIDSIEQIFNTPVGWRKNLTMIGIPEHDWMNKINDICKTGEEMPRKAIKEKPLHTKKLDSLLLIIAALCKHSEINPKDRGVATIISKAASSLGSPIDEDTVRDFLKLIPEAVDRRSK